MNTNFKLNNNSLLDESDEYDAESDSEYDNNYESIIKNSLKRFSLLIENTPYDWYKYHILFPHDDDDYFYNLYYEDQFGIHEKKDSYLIMKVKNNQKFLKELKQDDYDNHKWNENEYPIMYNQWGYDK